MRRKVIAVRMTKKNDLKKSKVNKSAMDRLHFEAIKPILLMSVGKEDASACLLLLPSSARAIVSVFDGGIRQSDVKRGPLSSNIH